MITNKKLEKALAYLEAGLSLIPIRLDGSKAPLGAWKQYQSRLPTPKEVRGWFAVPKPSGMALVCGKVSRGLEVIDFDEEAEVTFAAWRKIVESEMPDLFDKLTVVQTPGDGFHVWVRCEKIDTPGNTKLAMTDGDKVKVLIETRGQGGYALVPGCPAACHPSGKTYRYFSGPRLPMVSSITAREREVLINSARTLNRRSPDELPQTAIGRMGNTVGDEYCDRGPGLAALLQSAGWSEIQAGCWRRPGKKGPGISATVGRCRNSKGHDLLYVFSSNANPFQSDKGYSAFAVYAMLEHRGDFSAAAKELRRQGYGAASALPAAVIPEYEPFPVKALPKAIRQFVRAGAKAIGCDPAYLGLSILTVLAGAVGNSCRIRIKKSWSEPAIIWGAIVTQSGTRKSPALDLAKKFPKRRQKMAMERFRNDGDGYPNLLEKYKKDFAIWKKSGGDTDPPEKPVPPVPSRCLVDNTTIEALAPILGQNMRGVTIVKDELGGWLGGFGRYSKTGSNGEVQQWIEMFGARPLIIDRKTGTPSTIFVKRASVNIVGGIPLDSLRRLLGQENRDNGLLARLLLVCPPRKQRQWTDDDVDQILLAKMEEIYDRLFQFEMIESNNGEFKPQLIGLSPEALDLFKDFFNEHGKEEMELDGELSAAWSKLEGYAARFAVVHFVIRKAADDPTIESVTEVDAKSMAAGITLANWFGAEARRVYAMLDPDRADSQGLIALIEKKGGSITVRELQQADRRYRGSAELAEKALGRLVQTGIGEWTVPESTAKGGRPSRVFQLLR